MKTITSNYESFVQSFAKNSTIVATEKIQSLWSGYGEILRVHLQDCSHRSVILKRIQLPNAAAHPRGWNSDRSHQRKLKSYQVESYWYQHYANKCNLNCPVPKCLSLQENENETLLLLSDLAAEGFPLVKTNISPQEVHACLSWLAHFHAIFLQHPSKGLWDCGTYWHLDTRPDELAILEDKRLKQAAPWIDQVLKQCRYQTLVHGDAKLANFCFSQTIGDMNPSPVAAVDFQYVGAGCGMKDVVYFLGSCLSDKECKNQEEQLLNHYFQVLEIAVKKQHSHIDTTELEQEWRSLFDVAWADFHRFLKGWSPSHWKLNSYSEQLTRRVIERLQPNTTKANI